MNIEQAFYSFLNSNTNLSDFFENIEPHDRTDPLPMLAYRFISFPYHYETEAAWPRVQLDVWGSTYAQIKSGRVLVKDELHRWRGDMNGIPVKRIVSLSDMEARNRELDLWRQIMDFKIIFLRE